MEQRNSKTRSLSQSNDASNKLYWTNSNGAVQLVSPNNWHFREALKNLSIPGRERSFYRTVSGRVERVVRETLSRLGQASDARIIRYAFDGQRHLRRVQYREADAIRLDEDGLILYECKLTDDRKYVMKGLEQVSSIAEILRVNGYPGSIRNRLVVVSDDPRSIAGLAPDVPIEDSQELVGIVRIPTARLKHYAKEVGITLPKHWDNSAARAASSIFSILLADRGESNV